MNKKIGFYLVLFCIALLCAELTARAGLYFLKHHRNIFTSNEIPFVITPPYSEKAHEIIQMSPEEYAKEYTVFDPDLGWTLNPDSNTGELEDAYLATTNSIGTRNSRNYSKEVPPGSVRIAAFGDSFTHGSSLVNAYTWPEIMEKHNAHLEVLNYGVPGYGLDQAHLRYIKEGVKQSPDIVLICFMSEMMARNVNVFVPFYLRTSKGPTVKPRFALNNNELKLIPMPVKNRKDLSKLLEMPFIEKLAQTDYWSGVTTDKHFWNNIAVFELARLVVKLSSKDQNLPVSGSELRSHIFPKKGKHRTYNTDSEAYQLTLWIFDKFYGDVEANGSVPIIVFLPYRDHIQAYLDTGERIYEPLLQYLKFEKKYRVIDGMDILAPLVLKYGMSEISQSHYKTTGNRAIAVQIQKYLTRNGLAPDLTTSV